MFTANVTASGDTVAAMVTLLRRAAPDGSSIAMAATLRDLASVSLKPFSIPVHCICCAACRKLSQPPAAPDATPHIWLQEAQKGRSVTVTPSYPAPEASCGL